MKNYYLITVTTALFITFLIFAHYGDKRGRYEKYILSVYKTAPKHSKGDTYKTNNKTDEPDMAALQEFIKTVDPELKYVPKKRLVYAYNYTKQRERKYNSNITWENTGSNMGGRTRTLMFDPNDLSHKKVWAGAVTGGLWSTEDITNTDCGWEPVDDFWADLNVSCMAYDPNNTQIFYVGTGEAQTARIIYRASSGIGNGIYKTTDGGISWYTLESTINFDYITDIAVRDENGTSVIYACVASGTYMGEDHVSEPSDGLFRSEDGGITWQQVLPDIEGDDKPYTPADIEIASNGRIFIGTMENLNKKGGATILFSDTGLSGSWTIYDHYNDMISNEGYYNIPARTLVATSPSDPDIVYAQFAAGYVDGFTYYRGRYMAKSSDGGLNWIPMNIPDNDWSTLGWHAFVLKVSPTEPGKLFTGGLDLWNSSNAGYSWRHISDWSLMYYGGGDDYVHADQHKIVFQPENSNFAVFSSDGGIFISETTNQNYPIFIQRNQNYNTLQFYTCAIDPAYGSQRYIGGLQDNGTLMYHGLPLEIDDMITGGDGAFCFFDIDEPDIFITSTYYNRYSYWDNNSIVSYSNPSSGTFISPADYDYKNNILYSNAVGFFGSNANKLFRATNVPYVNATTEGHVYLSTNSAVPFSAITYSPYSPQGTSTLFIGTESGKLFKITNAQNSPQTEDITADVFPVANISCIAVGSSEDVLAVTFSNYGVSSVWLSIDGGESWEEKEANLPDMPIRWALFHPQNDNQLLLATETGVWATNNLTYENTEWSPAVDGMANVRVDMLKIRDADNIVLAASHGRGLFTAKYYLDIYDNMKENKNISFDFYLFPNPAKNFITVKTSLDKLTRFTVTVSTIAGKDVIKQLFAKTKNLNKTLDISKLHKGVYILTIKSEKTIKSKRFIIN
jgi:sugar lactone lactonase YvrE